MKLLPKKGYILLFVGIATGFLIFSAISLVFSGGGRQTTISGMPERIEIEFLYTSEKEGWIVEVTPRFEQWFKEKFDVQVEVRLIVGGTHETIDLILHESVKPTVWSPASSIWIPYINRLWRGLGYKEDIVSEWTPIVISPTVIAGWRSFVEDHDVTGFMDLHRLVENGVDFKYGHPDPSLSNGGAMVAILEFSEAAGKRPEDLTIDDLTNEKVLGIVKNIEARAVAYGKSTGFFGEWAVDNGPSAISYFGVYESVVLANSMKAQKKWGDPVVAIYPERGVLLSDHPYVIVDAEWVDSWQRFAAGQYLLFLLNEESQEAAQRHGFRPANPSIPLDNNVFSEENGVQSRLSAPLLKPPSGEVLEALFDVWTKVRNPGV